MARKSGLGKGLSALFQDNIEETSSTIVVNILDVEPNKEQPRRKFDEEAMASLADSIREHGIIQPIVVRPLLEGRYQIIAGERRWRASRMAGLKEVPIIIKDVDDKQTMEIALIENLQREDLNPIEEAKGYLMLMDDYKLTQDEVSKRVGKSRSAVANAIRLLSLPEEVIEELEQGNLSGGQGRALLSLGDEETIKNVALKAMSKGMSVRELEKLGNANRKKAKSERKKHARDHIYKELEISMQEELGRNVKIDVTSEGKGRLILDFYSKEELIDMAYALSNQKR